MGRQYLADSRTVVAPRRRGSATMDSVVSPRIEELAVGSAC